uniref:Uncharacterized protein n=1 Tax=Amazona collaria TaxID=241587 RepID=A0A8B9FKW6_9PSIT
MSNILIHSDFQISFFGRADCSHTNTKWLVRRLSNRTLSLTFFTVLAKSKLGKKKYLSRIAAVT